MSYINSLLETYDEIFKNEGYKNIKVREDKNGRFLEINELLPLYHNTFKCKWEIVTDINGKILNIQQIADTRKPPQGQCTAGPCTEKSLGRTGKDANLQPNGLIDKVKYFNTESESCKKFEEQISEWIKHERNCFIKECLLSIYKSIIKNNIYKWFKNKDIKIPEEDFVRWTVKHPDSSMPIKTYEDKRFYESWINFCKSTAKYKNTQIQGKEAPLCDISFKGIIRTGDGCKLIHHNRPYNIISFLGEDTVKVNAIEAQKITLALKFLIAKQGIMLYDGSSISRIILCWNPKNKLYQNPLSLCTNILKDEDDIDDDTTEEIFGSNLQTGEIFADKLKKSIWGNKELSPEDDIITLILSSDGNGKIYIKSYSVQNSQTLYNNIIKWHNTCQIDGTTPTLNEIIKLSKGTLRKDSNGFEHFEVDSKIEAFTIDRLLQSILDGINLPYDVYRGAILQVQKNQKYKNKNLFYKSLKTTCAIINKFNYDRRYNMTETDRSYLIGRLVGAYYKLEEHDRYLRGTGGDTNAERLFSAVQTNPPITLMQLSQKIMPYKLDLKKRKPSTAYFYEKEIQDLILSLEENINNKKALSPLFLTGYYFEINKLSNRKEENNEQEN